VELRYDRIVFLTIFIA